MNERQAFALADCFGFNPRFIEIGAVQHDTRTELPTARNLVERRELRHHDSDGNGQQAGVIGNALCVIAGRRRDHAPFAGFVRKLQQRVARAALLETAGALQIVELAIDPRAGELRQWN